MTTNSNFDDVKAFHAKFGVPEAQVPAFLDPAAHDFRVKFMQEELQEFIDDSRIGNMHGAADALVDLVYVALGTAAMMGLPWQELWDEVQRANISKVRASSDGSNSKRKSALDVVKPAGWRAPDHTAALGNIQEYEWPVFNASGE